MTKRFSFTSGTGLFVALFFFNMFVLASISWGTCESWQSPSQCSDSSPAVESTPDTPRSPSNQNLGRCSGKNNGFYRTGIREKERFCRGFLGYTLYIDNFQDRAGNTCYAKRIERLPEADEHCGKFVQSTDFSEEAEKNLQKSLMALDNASERQRRRNSFAGHEYAMELIFGLFTNSVHEYADLESSYESSDLPT